MVNILNFLINRNSISRRKTGTNFLHPNICKMKRWYSTFIIMGIVFAAGTGTISADEKKILTPDTPDSKIVFMHPKKVDPSQLPLDSIEDLHTTGRPREVDVATWRLEIKGTMIKNPLLLKYEDLLHMATIKKNVLLICPAFFADYAQWEGIPLSDILTEAGVKSNYKKITFNSMDGYSSSFTREEIENNLLFLSLKVNGETLPKKHGFPVRLVAENFYGGKWVKWIKTIDVQ